MKGSDRLSEGVRALLKTAAGVLPAIGVGVVQRDDAGCVTLTYADGLGATAHRARAVDFPQRFRIQPPGLQCVAATDLETNPYGLVESRLLQTGMPDEIRRALKIQQVLLLAIPYTNDATTLVVGFADGGEPTAAQIAELNVLASSVPEFLEPLSVRNGELDTLRRLEAAERLLPAMFGILDVREIFDRLSGIAKEVLRHDFAALGVLSDDLKRIELYVQTSPGTSYPIGGQMPFPPAQTEAWLYRFVDDLTANPLERNQETARAGGRSSLRVAVRLEQKVLGALNFTSRDVVPYSAADLRVALRIADYVALALSHQRLADQARHHEALRARAEKAELLDEALASVLGAGDVAAVFDRVSSVTQKVVTHDAMLLAIRLPDGQRAKIYASSAPRDRPFPDVVDVPPRLLSDPKWEFDVVEDLKAEPDQQHLWTTRNGYRATLRVPIRLDDEFVGGLSFLSFTPGHYSDADVPVARRIAERLALGFARERGATLLKRADEAAARASRLESRVRALTEELDARTGYRRVVGESRAWRQVLTQTTQVATTETTVLLLGESGTGKEVVARFLHRASTHANGPFVALNCAALPEQLLEAELFGYERGAFTGATQSKPGQLEQAAGGTLFLDEVAEMSPSAQAKFLRVLQEREFQRLGGTRVQRTDTRIVAATNRDLQRAIAQGQFREDLYYRLNVFAIRLPPLRDRPEDILPLSETFLAEIGHGIGRPPAGISRDARKLLIDYRWPGNVRELRNILERAAILCEGGLITAEYLSLDTRPAPILAPALPASPADPAPPERPSSAGDLQSMERTMIKDALQNARYNKSKAAKALGLTRQQLYVRMRKYALE